MSGNGNGNGGGTALAKPRAADEVRRQLATRREAIQRLMPRDPEKVDRLIESVAICVARNPKLGDPQACNPQSLILSAIGAAQLGLDLSPALQHAFLVPYKGEVQLQIGYRGMVELASRSGRVAAVRSAVVYEGDHFEFELGMRPALVHRYDINAERVTPIAAYAVVKLAGGSSQFEVMSYREIEKIRNGAPSKDSPAWRNHWAEMAKKTVLKRALKVVPQSPEMARAIEADNAAELGEPQNLVEERLPPMLPATSRIDDLNAALDDYDDGSAAEEIRREATVSTPKQLPPSEPAQSSAPADTQIAAYSDEQLGDDAKFVDVLANVAMELGTSEEAITKLYGLAKVAVADLASQRRQKKVESRRAWVTALMNGQVDPTTGKVLA